MRKLLFSLLGIGATALIAVFAVPAVQAVYYSNSCGTFQDVSATSQYCNAIQYVNSRGVMTGYSSTQFGPYDTVKRSEALKIVLKGFVNETVDTNNIPSGANFGFYDTPATYQWWYPYLQKALQKGLVSGYPDGYFRPLNSVKRVELMKMIEQATEDALGLKYSYWEYENGLDISKKGWTDVSNDWGQPYMDFAAANKLLNNLDYCGYNMICPGNELSRQEVAQILYNYKLYVGKDVGFTGGTVSTGTPVLQYPLSNAVYGNTSNVSVPFSWNAASNASYYKVMIRLSNSSSYFVNATTYDTNYSYYFNVQNTTQGYYWKVRAYDVNGNYKESGERYLSFGNVNVVGIGAPVLVSPGNFATISMTGNTNINFDWDPVSGASHYYLMVRMSNSSSYYFNTKVTATNYLYLYNAQNQSYYWKVRAYDVEGNYKDSAERYFTLTADTSPVLSTPTQLGPQDQYSATASDGGTVPVTFTWNSPSAAHTYVMVRSAGSSGYFINEKVDYALNLTYYFNQPSSGSQGYYWKMRATDIYGNYKDSGERYFEIVKWTGTGSLGVPALVSPSANEPVYNANQNITFSWNAVSGASYYNLEVGSSSWASDALDVNVYGTSATYSFEPLSAKNYYWRVRVYDANGNNNVSAERIFTVLGVNNLGPSTPTLSSPVNGASIAQNNLKGTVFSWSSPSTVNTYEYRLRASGSNTLITDEFVDLQKSYTNNYDVPLATGTYYWKVRAHDGNGNYKDSAEWSFTVTQTLGFSTLIAPANPTYYTDGENPNITFSWTPATGAVKYELMIKFDGQANYTSVYIWNGASNVNMSRAVSAMVFPELTKTMTDYWLVRAYDANGNYTVSAVSKFVINQYQVL